jgi:hypothetical protein
VSRSVFVGYEREDHDVLDDLPPAPGAWVEHAACGQLGNPEAFTGTPKPAPEDLALAAAVCRHCEVRSDCDEYAATFAVWGLWAGRWYDGRQPPRSAEVAA